MNFGLEARVGVFVVAATVLLAVMGIIFGKIDLSKDKGYDVTFEIADASGVNKDVPVYFRGLKVGKVKSVSLNGSRLNVIINVNSDYKIPDNVIFTVRQQGFVGEKFVELSPDPGIVETGYLEPGGVYTSYQPVVGMDVVMRKIDRAADQLATLVTSLNSVFSQEDNKAALGETIRNLRDITAKVERIVDANDAKFSEIIENTRRLTAVLDGIVERNERSVDKSLANIEELTASLKNFSASVDKLVAENKDNLEVSMDRIKSISVKVDEAMSDVQAITKDINEGKGTLGMLINDNETKENVQSLVKNVKSMVSRVSDYKLYVTFGGDYMFDVNETRGYVNLRLHTNPSTFYQLGVSNTPRSDTKTTTKRYQLVTLPGNSGSIVPNGTVAYESTEDEYKSSKLAFSLQYGHIFNRILGMRVGIFESTIGGALDFYPLRNDNLTASIEMYDFDSFDSGFEAYTRAYIRWHFFRNFFIQGGVEDLLNNSKRAFALGGGVRFADDDLKYFAGSVGSVIQ